MACGQQREIDSRLLSYETTWNYNSHLSTNLSLGLPAPDLLYKSGE